MQVVLSKKAEKQLEKLDTQIQKRIKKFVLELESLGNPRSKGKALVGNFAGFWRYRIGDYRIICEIIDKELIIYTIDIAHRSEIYD